MLKKAKVCVWILAAVAVLCLLFSVILPAVYAPRTDIRTFAEVYDLEVERIQYAAEPSELELVSDLVILFTPREYVTRCASDSSGMSYMITAGIVDRVLSGDMRPSEEIQVIEYCWFNDTKLITMDCYFPMHMGKTYLLFLKQDSVKKGCYSIVDLHCGKYVLDARTGPLAQLYLDEGSEFELTVATPYQQMLAERYVDEWYMPVRALYPEVFV